MSNNTETSCCDKCEEEYKRCIASDPGNPTFGARCEKRKKNCQDACNGGEGC